MPQPIIERRREYGEPDTDVFRGESYPFSVIAIALAGLAFGDAAVVLAMLANTGWSH